MNPERTGRGKTWMQVSVYLVIAFALMLFPITRVVHAESSAIVAGCAFFLTGLCLIRSRTGLSYAALAASILASLIPFLILSVTTLFAVECGCSAYLQGSFIYFLFVPPSVLLGIALATFITSRKVRKPTLIFVVTGVVLATIPVVLTLRFFPQFYVYNHVFGGVLGPIYDDQLYIRSGLVVFRVLTLLWAVLLFSPRVSSSDTGSTNLHSNWLHISVRRFHRYTRFGRLAGGITRDDCSDRSL